MFGLVGLGAGSTFSASFVDCAVPCLQRPDTETTEQTNGELRPVVRRSRTESHLESPPKTAYRFLGMAPPWPPTRRGDARRTRNPRSCPTSSSGARTGSSMSSGLSWACRPQPDRGARIHDVLRTQALPRRGGCSEGKRLPRRDRDRRGAFHPPEPVLLRRE